MHAKKILIIIMVLLMTVLACGAAEDSSEDDRVTAVGTIERSGFTSYMYGTHILRDDNGHTRFALKSDTINLDDYVGIKDITVKGSLISGYPVDNGPEYLNVTEIE